MVLFDTDHDVIGTIDFIKFEVGVNLVSAFILIHVVFDVAAKFAEGRKELNDFDGRVVFFDWLCNVGAIEEVRVVGFIPLKSKGWSGEYGKEEDKEGCVD